MPVKHPRDRVDDVGEPDRPVVEGVDAHLVGRVVDRRPGAARAARAAGERDRGERLVVERQELPGLGDTPVGGDVDIRQPIGPGQPEGCLLYTSRCV